MASSTSAILAMMAEALPSKNSGDTTSDICSSYEAVALLLHALCVSTGFRFLGLDEEVSDGKESSVGSEPRLPQAWNAHFGSHTLVYSHPGSPARKFVLRVDRIGGTLEIRAAVVGSDVVHRFERAARELVSSSALPVRISTGADGSENRGDLPGKLSKAFGSKERVTELIQVLSEKIISRLVATDLLQRPFIDADERDARAQALQESMAQAGQETQADADKSPQVPQSHFDPPRVDPPERQHPVPVGDFPAPGFEDEFEINRPPAAFPGGMLPPGLAGSSGPSPFSIGHDDLSPPGLGPRDPLRPNLGPLGGIRGPGGGMHPTFDDPLFAGQGGRGAGGENSQVPPGARWDPIGPPGMRFPGGRGPGNGGGGFGGGFNGDLI